MEKIKIIDVGLRIFIGVISGIGLFISTGFILFSFSIMNLIVTILSFDELFVNSPFNQTTIENISNNVQPTMWASMYFFMIGLILAVCCVFLLIGVISGQLKLTTKKEE